MSEGEAQRSKGFDCVEFKGWAKAGIYERMKDLSPEEGVDNFRKAAEASPLSDSRTARTCHSQPATADA